jgi:hypothetical protein
VWQRPSLAIEGGQEGGGDRRCWGMPPRPRAVGEQWVKPEEAERRPEAAFDGDLSCVAILYAYFFSKFDFLKKLLNIIKFKLKIWFLFKC